MKADRPESAAALAALLHDASAPGVQGLQSASRPAFRIRGAGGWPVGGAGASTADARALDLSAFSGVRTYRPGDLTITVGAATTLAELGEVTHEHGQWCPLLPWGDDGGTVGATIATASTGPFAAALGRPRDLVLGLECVDGRGRLIAAGGSVVKNVAGFDLTRLMTGAWGTLGVITALHLRLRSRPVVDESFILSAGEEMDAAVEAVARGPYAPLAAHRVGATSAAALQLPPQARWVIRLGGNRAFVAASRKGFAEVGDLAPIAADAWDVVRAHDAPEGSESRAARWKWTALSRRIKEQFDPADLLNRGLLGSAK